MADITVTYGVGAGKGKGKGWSIAIVTQGAQPTLSSDAGELDIAFNSVAGVPGALNIVGQGSIMIPAVNGVGPGTMGEIIDIDLTVNNAVGTVVGTIQVKGAGKGR